MALKLWIDSRGNLKAHDNFGKFKVPSELTDAIMRMVKDEIKKMSDERRNGKDRERRKDRDIKRAPASRKRAMAVSLQAAGFTQEEIESALGIGKHFKFKWSGRDRK